MPLCDAAGHRWVLSPSLPGWFVCNTCQMMAYCPGCRHFQVYGYPVLFCAHHDGQCCVEDFPVLMPYTVPAAPAPDSQVPMSPLSR